MVFVPIEAVDKVSRTIFDAGAGRIGNYSSCSFRTAGLGTFFGNEGTTPTVGKSGRLEKVDEIRLETVVPVNSVGAVIAALRESHPYEEPAFDLNVLAAVPGDLGQGKIGSMEPVDRAEVFARIKRGLGIEHLLIAGPTEGKISRAACCAGSCGEYFGDAIKQKAQLFLTGEMRHHDATQAMAAGVTIVCTLHSNSERPVLARLAKRLAETEGMPEVRVSQADQDPFLVV